MLRSEQRPRDTPPWMGSTESHRPIDSLAGIVSVTKGICRSPWCDQCLTRHICTRVAARRISSENSAVGYSGAGKFGMPKAVAGKKRTRLAAEANGVVSVLCFACRRSTDSTKQQGLTAFFTPAASKPATSEGASVPSTSMEGTTPGSARSARQCSKCRCVMEHKVPSRTADKSVASSSTASKSRVLPQISRLRQYQRLASDQGIPFVIAEHAATALMREACTMCGVAAPAEGHGLTRLRIWPEGVPRWALARCEPRCEPRCESHCGPDSASFSACRCRRSATSVQSRVDAAWGWCGACGAERVARSVCCLHLASLSCAPSTTPPLFLLAQAAQGWIHGSLPPRKRDHRVRHVQPDEGRASHSGLCGGGRRLLRSTYHPPAKPQH